MFEQANLLSGPAPKRVWSTFAGVTGQALVVGCMLVAPMVFPQTLPMARSIISLTAPPPPPPPPPGPVVRPKGTVRVLKQISQTTLTMPRLIPLHPQMIVDPLDLPESTGRGVEGGIPGGKEDGVVGGVLAGLGETRAPAPQTPVAVATPKPVTQAAPVAPQRIRGGIVDGAVPIHRIEPRYPVLAQQMHVSGVVQLEGVIGVDGRIHELRLISGHPLLAKAALDAVSQWVYQPTRLNGVPVEVIAPITVTFTLNSR